MNEVTAEFEADGAVYVDAHATHNGVIIVARRRTGLSEFSKELDTARCLKALRDALQKKRNP